MYRTRPIGAALSLSLVTFACSAAHEVSPEQTASVSSAVYHVKCNQVEPTDILISELVHFSVMSDYSLTLLGVDGSGNVEGDSMPDLVAGQVELINTVPTAKADLVEALENISGEPAYTIEEVNEVPDLTGCSELEVWTPNGTTFVDTPVFEVVASPETWDAWDDVHKEIAKVCPLVNRHGTDKDLVDPAGDGSTNLPPSETVSSTGVRANAFGICPAGTATGAYCMLSYATGINWTGRWCQPYYGQLRCVLK